MTLVSTLLAPKLHQANRQFGCPLLIKQSPPFHAPPRFFYDDSSTGRYQYSRHGLIFFRHQHVTIPFLSSHLTRQRSQTKLRHHLFLRREPLRIQYSIRQSPRLRNWSSFRKTLSPVLSLRTQNSGSWLPQRNSIFLSPN
jgi:hypothetical protein